MKLEKHYMVSLKIERPVESNCFAESFHMIINDENREFKNLFCNEKTAQALIDIIKDKIPKTDYVVATIKTGGVK